MFRLPRPLTLMAASLATLCAGLSGAQARMIQVNVENDTPNTIYKLYAWPSDLVPRTYSLITNPIQPGESKEVAVEDAFNSCVFNFQASFTNPVKSKTRPLRRPIYLPNLYKYRVSICPPRYQKDRGEVQKVKLQPVFRTFQ